MKEILSFTSLLNHHRDGGDTEDRDFELTFDAQIIIRDQTIAHVICALRYEQNLLVIGDPYSEDEIENPLSHLKNEDILLSSTHSEVNLPNSFG